MERAKVVKFVVNYLEEEGFTDIKANLPGMSRPPAIKWKTDKMGITPDILLTKERMPILFEIEAGNLQYSDRQIDKWKLFSTYATVESGHFYLVVDNNDKIELEKKLQKFKLRAKILPIKGR